MRKTISIIVFFLVLLQFSLFLRGAVPASERAALIALYNSTAGDKWSNNTNWLGAVGSEGTWYGITVQRVGGMDRVTEIDLSGNNLTGTLPPEFFALYYLENLSLYYNNLSGTIPEGIGNLNSLRYLYLYVNHLTGGIPQQIGNLDKLILLNLNSNDLSGAIPKEIGNISTLKSLYLSANNLSGSLPAEIFNLDLTDINLDHNSFSGITIADFLVFRNLRLLSLANLNLTGSITNELGDLSNLEYLSLAYNNLSGGIPKELENLKELSKLSLERNELSGGIPGELGNLTGLRNLFLNGNKLSGSIPASLINLSNLHYLGIGYNALYTDNIDLKNFLDSMAPNWRATQTIAPANLSVVAQTPTAVKVTWTPIVFTSHEGGYRVLYSTSSGGAYVLFGETGSKSDSSQLVSGLTPGAVYYFVVQTKTNSGWYNDNTVLSEYSQEVSATLPSAPPGISLNRNKLNFAVSPNGATSAPQTFFINNSGGGTLNWVITDNVNWLNYSADSGTGSALVSVSVSPTGLIGGTYSARIAVSDNSAWNSPQLIDFTLKVHNAGATSKPFGDFATPANDSIVSSSVPVTGWALDDIGIDSVKIYRTSGNNSVYIGDAIFIEGARPDLEQAFPNTPNNYKGGWGYMMLTYFLPNQGNGAFTLQAKATDVEGNTATLGTKTIICDNANAVKPFGAIDTPAQGGTASGSGYVNHGWVLTPPPNKMPESGSTIDVYVDGVNLGNPIYNIRRNDIAELFPDYANKTGAGGYLSIDTTVYPNGIHEISWSAVDDVGNADGIGSRYFTVQNSQSTRSKEEKTVLSGECLVLGDGVINSQPIRVKKGFRRDRPAAEFYPDEKGTINLEIKELQRIVIHLGDDLEPTEDPAAVHSPLNTQHSTLYQGFLVVGGGLRPLPIGSTLDRERGVFYWIPGPGFVGNYELVFFNTAGNETKQTRVNVRILPKH